MHFLSFASLIVLHPSSLTGYQLQVRVTAPLHHFDTDLKRNQWEYWDSECHSVTSQCTAVMINSEPEWWSPAQCFSKLIKKLWLKCNSQLWNNIQRCRWEQDKKSTWGSERPGCHMLRPASLEPTKCEFLKRLNPLARPSDLKHQVGMPF